MKVDRWTESDLTIEYICIESNRESYGDDGSHEDRCGDRDIKVRECPVSEYHRESRCEYHESKGDKNFFHTEESEKIK